MLRHAISDGTAALFKSQERLSRLRAWARRCSDDGVDAIQIREKSLTAGELLELATAIREAVAGSGSPTKVLLNSRADIAVAAGVNGIHLTASPGELTPPQVRTVFAAAGCSSAIVSVSCHTVAEVARARDLAADIILFGPVFGKVVAGEAVMPGAGLNVLTEAVRGAETVPVLALGGVTPANTGACLQAGAAGVAGIRLFP